MLGLFASLSSCARNAPIEVVHPTSSLLRVEVDDTPEARNRANFPQTMRLLDEADARLLRGEALEAIVLAKQARGTFAAEERDSQDEDAARRVMSRCALVLAEARRETGGPLEAMLSLSRREAFLEPEQCLGPDAVSRCKALAKELHSEFPHIVPTEMSLEFKAYEILLDGGTSIERMKGVDDTVDVAKMDSFALSVVPSSIKRTPDGGADIRVEGTMTASRGTSHATVAKVRFGSATVDLARNTSEASAFKRADLVAHVPATDAALLDGARLVVKLFIDRKQWKHAGNVWNAGVVRVMDVGELATGS
ncbi:hypothetical protein [Labilithrix luteola]|uniref:hypothetical protein n=1 Tax=Labilithrix luteola TaxID=1391654 RepID=UPI0011BAD1E8|nr:hypothetical protein [Labilithrix luteola]